MADSAIVGASGITFFMLRTRVSFAYAHSRQDLVSLLPLCRTNIASQPSPDPLGQHTHLQNNAHWLRLQRKFRIKFSFLGNWQHLEFSAQDSHFWSSIDNAPRKPVMKLTKMLGISSQPWLSRDYLSPLMAQGYIAQILPKKPKFINIA